MRGNTDTGIDTGAPDTQPGPLRPLRVCFVSLRYRPYVGGAERRIEKQAIRLQRLGHGVMVMTTRGRSDWPTAETLDGVPVTRIGKLFKPSGDLRIGRAAIWPVALELAWLLWRRRHEYDVIHVGQMSPLAALAAAVARIAGKPIVISIQNTGPDNEQRATIASGVALMSDGAGERERLVVAPDVVAFDVEDATSITALGGSLLAWYVRHSGAVFQALSSRSRTYLTERGFPADRIVAISGSVDAERFQPTAGKRPDPALPDRPILCIARHQYSKGIDVLLTAWSRMMHGPAEWREGLTPRLLLAGDGHIRPQLEYLASTLGIADSVEFLGRREDVIDLLQHAWAFVLPSRWEGMPNALLEAMACGVPSIATRVSGSEDLIQDGETGLLVEPEDPEAMAGALRHIIADHDLAFRLGTAGRQAIVQRFTVDDIVDSCLDLYRSLLARGDRPSPGVPQDDPASEPRIYFVSDTFLPIVGGLERMVMDQATWLRRRGYETAVVTIRQERAWPAREVLDGVPVFRVGGWVAGDRTSYPGPLRKLAYAAGAMAVGWRLWRDRERYDVISYHSLSLLMLPVALAAVAARKPLVAVLHSARSTGEGDIAGDLESLDRLGPVLRRLGILLLRCGRAVLVAVSSRMQREVEASDIRPAEIVRIPNGIDLASFAPDGVTTENRARTVIYIGRLAGPKGVDVLLRAWPRVCEAVPNAQLLILGDGPLREALQEQASALGITGSVRFAGMQHDVPVWFRQASIFVLPSRHEGMPRGLLEAMAAGLAPVATRVSGSEDMIDDGISGYLVEPLDDDALSEALIKLLRNPDMARGMGMAARRTVEERYDDGRVLDMYVDLYTRLARLRERQ